MRDRNKNNKTSITGFIRYTDDRMNGRERNAFEKELQRDPFTKEALEGLSSIPSQEALKDISSLQIQLKKRIVKRQRFLYYGIAASIAVLIAVSSVFIVIEINKSPKQIASNINNAETAEITESRPVMTPAGKKEPSEKQVSSPDKKREKSSDEIIKAEAEAAVIEVDDNIIADHNNKDSIPEIEPEPSEKALMPEQITAVSPSAAGAKRSEESKMAVTEYDAVGSVSEKKDMPAGYMPPQPAGGKSGFDKYVRENLQRPDTLSSGQRVIVVLNFLVRTDGSIDSIRVIRSQGKAFSDEAIRLLQSGPAWKPAEEDGQIIEGQVRIQIVFK